VEYRYYVIFLFQTSSLSWTNEQQDGSPCQAEEGIAEAGSFAPPSIAFITFSHLNTLDNLLNLINASLSTWLVDDALYVIYSETSRTSFATICQHAPKPLCERIVPIFVDCPDGYWGESPCCKMQKGLFQIYEHYGERYQFFVYMDDDQYLRRLMLSSFLAQFDASRPILFTAGSLDGSAATLGQSGYLHANASYQCSTSADFTYPWGLLTVYSREALKQVLNGFRLGGLVRVCKAFKVTHDVGNAIFHWMFGLTEVRIHIAYRFPFLSVPLGASRLNESFGMHGVAATKGQFGKPNNMTTIHNSYKLSPFQLPTIHKFKSRGFQSTSIYQQYGDPRTWTEWHAFTPRDCARPSP
jgi:hypothetical protein